MSGFRTATKGHARLCLTEARVPSFNGEKADLKPAITSFYMYFYVIPFFSPLKSGTRASLRHESVTALKVVTDLCLSEARVPDVPDFNGEKKGKVCSGSIMVTTLDCGPRGCRFKSRVGANIL